MEQNLLDYALLGAIVADEPATITKMIEKGADMNCRDRSGQTALHLACEKGGVHSVEALVAAGADVNSRDGNDRTPLFSAILGLDKRSVDVMIRSGVNINVKDRNGLNAEAFASQAMMYTLADEIRRLSAHPADVDVTVHRNR